MRRSTQLPALALSGVLLLGLVGCSGDDAGEAQRPGDTEARSKILQPGQPGEANETLDPDTTLEPDAWNDADEQFMSMMVPHHAQALEMSQLAPQRAESRTVLRLARRIQGAQGPEIRSMATWLASRDLPVPEAHDHGDHGDHGGMTMLGMLTPEQMTELEQAEGAEFDRLYLAGMIQHHQGAVDMAGTELEEGQDTLALELAGEVSAGQTAEIRRMVEIRRNL